MPTSYHIYQSQEIHFMVQKYSFIKEIKTSVTWMTATLSKVHAH